MGKGRSTELPPRGEGALLLARGGHLRDKEVLGLWGEIPDVALRGLEQPVPHGLPGLPTEEATRLVARELA